MVPKQVVLLALAALCVPSSTGWLDILTSVLEAPIDVVSDVITTLVNNTDNDDEDLNVDWLYELFDLKDQCDPNPCLSNGICEVLEEGFKCTCQPPYKGKKCQKVDSACSKVKCAVGECVITATPPYHECKCKAPFQPPSCRKPSVCDPDPCQNEGICLPGRTRASFRCHCPDEFSGQFCEVGPEDCYEGNGESYRGVVSETEDGEDCLPWNAYLLLEKGIDPVTEYGEDEGIGRHNFCRNPDGDQKPWCFIKHRKGLRWDHCTVRKCSGSANDTESPTPPEDSEEVEPTEAPLGNFSTCGRPQPSGLAPRIHGGSKALPGYYPWQASLQVRTNGSKDDFSHSCGGTLIRPCWVLTAAHCIDKQNEMRIVLGTVNIEKVDSSAQTFEVQEVKVHEKYKETFEALYNDIALLRLKPVDGQCAKETEFVMTACLPSGPFPDGTECKISGWGATEKSYSSSQLLNAAVLLISQSRCMAQKAYGSVLDDGMLCAGNMKGGVDSCQGDSGGPLTCQQEGTHILYGVVSWGDSCGKRNKPGIYARVNHFNDWIHSKLQES